MQVTLSDTSMNAIRRAVRAGVEQGVLGAQQKSIENISVNIGKIMDNTLDGVVKKLPNMIKSFNEIDKIINES